MYLQSQQTPQTDMRQLSPHTNRHADAALYIFIFYDLFFFTDLNYNQYDVE